MRKSLTVLALVQALFAVVVAVGQPSRATISVDEIQPGMRGYGLTVFRGTVPERFDVEVIDVLHNFRPDMDLILVRTDHPILDHASTVAGMSGSPIYLNGRLAGAYAYGWPFGKDPVAGVTPIGDMFAARDRPVRPDAFPGADRLTNPLAVVREPAVSREPRLAGLRPYLGTRDRDAFTPLREHVERVGTSVGGSGVVPAATPVMLGGFTDAAAHALGEHLKPLGLVTLQAGGGSASDTEAEPRFVDGGAIGVQLVRGDVSATAVGTVTHVGPNRLVAFGHPMLNAGEVGLPTSTARVLHILASESRSFKIAEAAAPMGTLIHDRLPAIVVDPNAHAETIPVHLRVRGIPGAPRTEWNMEVVSHRVLSPILTFSALTSALGATASDQDDVMLTVTSQVELEGHGPVTVVDRGYTPAGPSDARSLARLRLFDLMEVAYGNPFEESRIRNVDVAIDVRFARDVWEVLDASVAHETVDPGARVNVHVVLRRFGRPDQTRIVPLRIPESAAGENLEVTVQAGDEVGLDHPHPQSLDDLVRVIRSRLPATDLVVSLKRATRGLRFQGHMVRDLPASALDSLQLVNDTDGGTPFVTHDRRQVDIGEVLHGKATIRLTVREQARGT